MAIAKNRIKMAAIAAIVILPILGILVLAKAKWVHKELPLGTAATWWHCAGACN